MSSNSLARPLRLWPGVAAAILLVALRFGLPIVWPEQAIVAVLGGVGCALGILVWWGFFSRAPWRERVGAIVMMAFALTITWLFADVSITTGAMGALLPMLAIPPMTVAFVAWAATAKRFTDGQRWITMAAVIFLACGAWTLAKTGGFTSGFDNDLMWRWAATPEDRLVADASSALPLAPERPFANLSAADSSSSPIVNAPTEPAAAAASEPAAGEVAPALPEPEWPGFRGSRRDGIVRGARIDTDWSAHPPVELWRRAVGPGWSSFSVSGDRIYTQEQRGEDEIVASYNLTTGKPIWSHRDAARFWESNGGAGPRGTPTLHRGRAYAFGATGLLNALDLSTGALIWQKNVVADTHAVPPTWGFSSSPLVIDDVAQLVVVAAAGTLAAYDLKTGTLRWVGPNHSVNANGAYSSPQRLTIDGVDQIVMLSEAGATSVTPADGKVLWEYAMPGGPILQPVLTADGDLLIHEMAMDGALAIRRLSVKRNSESWAVAERWTSTGLKTMFNDFVVNKGYAFGFDGTILSCVDLKDGARKWKGGRYGAGQLVLLADQDVLLVLSEEGELALVSATPDGFKQLARVPAIEGKTWNHPVVVRDILLVRNGEEMAAFRLSPGR